MRPPRDPAKGKASTRIALGRQRSERLCNGPLGPLLTLTRRVVDLIAPVPPPRRSESSVSGGCSLMADSRVAGVSLNDVRASMKRAQTEGRKLVTRLRKDATSMVNRPPLDVLSDARKRAGKAFEDLDVQQRRLRTFVAGRVTGLASQVVTRVGLASAHDVADLKRRLGELERRLERVTKHQAA